MIENSGNNNLKYIHSWDRQIRLCEIDETLDKKSKEEIKLAIAFLRKEFGEDFLFNSNNKSHFLVQKLIHNRGSSIFQWILWFVDSFKIIKTKSKDDSGLIKKLKNKLGNPNTAFNELIHIDKFLRSKHYDCNLYPVRGKKKPDFVVNDKSSSFSFDVEITQQQPKKGFFDFFTTWMLLHEPFLKLESKRIYFVFSIILYTPDIAKTVIEKLVLQIEKDILEVVENKTLKSFEKKYLIKYVIGHVYRRNEVEKWCQENDTDNNIVKLDTNLLTPAIASVKAKIDDKMKTNLANSETGLVIINDPNLISLNDLEEKSDFEEIIINIQQTVLKYPNLIGVILSSGLYYTIRPHDTIEKEEYTVICNKDDPNNLYYIIIWNSNFAVPFSNAQKQKIVSLFKSESK